MPEPNLPFFGLRDPISAGTHYAAFILAIAGTILLWRLARGNRIRQFTLSVFGISMIALYLASATYHALRLPPERLEFYRMLDHSAIYGLIVGTYTPALAALLRLRLRKVLILSSMWFLAGAGIACKWLLPDSPYWLTVLVYLGLGWVGLIPLLELVNAVGFRAMGLALCGGLCYTLGGVVDVIGWPNLYQGVFGTHELFHLCTMGGTICHYLFMVRYVIPFTLPLQAELGLT
jgi:hemolysin III